MSGGFLFRALSPRAAPDTESAHGARTEFPVTRSAQDWRNSLSPNQYQVLRQHGTERPFSHPLNDEKRPGTFHCAGCGAPLFDAATKYDSGSGWPSFFQPLGEAVGTTSDHTLGMPRVEVHCAQCGGHLGHVFEDGPAPTGLRYCMNGTALAFEPLPDKD